MSNDSSADGDRVSSAAPPKPTPTQPVPTPTQRPPTPLVPAHPPLTALIGTVALLVVVAESAANVLSDDPLFWIVTPLRAIVVLAFASLLVTTPTARHLRSAPDIGIALLVLGATLACARYGGWSWWRGLLTYVLIYYLAVGTRRAGGLPWSQLGMLALVAMTGPALLGIAQRANDTATGFCRAIGPGAMSDSCEVPGAAIRVVGTFPNPILLAAFLVLLVPLALASLRSGRLAHASTLGIDRPWAALVIVGSLAGYLAIHQTISRGAWAAMLVGLAILVALLDRRRRFPRALAAVLGAGVLAMLVALAAGYDPGVRSDVWGAAFDLIRENPLGVGLGRGGTLLTDRVEGAEQFAHAHNMWIHWFLEAGVLAFGGLVVMVVMLWISMRRADMAGSPSVVPLAASLGSFAALSMVDHTAGALRIAVLLAVLLACAATAGTDAPVNPTETATAAARPRVWRRRVRW